MINESWSLLTVIMLIATFVLMMMPLLQFGAVFTIIGCLYSMNKSIEQKVEKNV